ncbi:hypothetical protein FB45DRAFT_862794 [Roridomyces roridus]|uniref:Uncharacterized protein n=1 Tax=Roridomyces roridus TaxID=1738132 RepID=A0AAD7FWG3_9AGAR|nr:hypothetical protein FB45DRAFT_862794 [Roridomyces roridus]
MPGVWGESTEMDIKWYGDVQLLLCGVKQEARGRCQRLSKRIPWPVAVPLPPSVEIVKKRETGSKPGDIHSEPEPPASDEPETAEARTCRIEDFRASRRVAKKVASWVAENTAAITPFLPFSHLGFLLAMVSASHVVILAALTTNLVFGEYTAALGYHDRTQGKIGGDIFETIIGSLLENYHYDVVEKWVLSSFRPLIAVAVAEMGVPKRSAEWETEPATHPHSQSIPFATSDVTASLPLCTAESPLQGSQLTITTTPDAHDDLCFLMEAMMKANNSQTSDRALTPSATTNSVARPVTAHLSSPAGKENLSC